MKKVLLILASWLLSSLIYSQPDNVKYILDMYNGRMQLSLYEDRDPPKYVIRVIAGDKNSYVPHGGETVFISFTETIDSGFQNLFDWITVLENCADKYRRDGSVSFNALVENEINKDGKIFDIFRYHFDSIAYISTTKGGGDIIIDLPYIYVQDKNMDSSITFYAWTLEMISTFKGNLIRYLRHHNIHINLKSSPQLSAPKFIYFH
jgi:hypothetical protein